MKYPGNCLNHLISVVCKLNGVTTPQLQAWKMNFQNSPENIIILVTGILKKAPKGKVEKHLPNHQSFLVQNLTFSGCMLLIKDPLQNGCAGPWHWFFVPNDTGTWRISPLHFSRSMDIQKNIMYIHD